MHPIYTAGYGQSGCRKALQRSVTDLRRMADDLGAVVVDIRYAPYSNRPEWRQESLMDVFGDRYLWLRELGNVNYKGGGPITLSNPAGGIPRLISAAEDSPLILLCACAAIEGCHRRVVSELLAGRGIVTSEVEWPDRQIAMEM